MREPQACSRSGSYKHHRPWRGALGRLGDSLGPQGGCRLMGEAKAWEQCPSQILPFYHLIPSRISRPGVWHRGGAVPGFEGTLLAHHRLYFLHVLNAMGTGTWASHPVTEESGF